MPRSDRPRPPKLNLDDMPPAGDMASEPIRTPGVSLPLPAATRPALVSMPSSDSLTGSIRFRTDSTPTRTLYSGSAAYSTADLSGLEGAFPRKQSLVKVEDYLPPSAVRNSMEGAFNPYQTPVRVSPTP